MIMQLIDRLHTIEKHIPLKDEKLSTMQEVRNVYIE